MGGHEVSMHGVHGRNPDQATPADVVTRTIVLNIHGAEVSGLPPKELGNVDGLKKNRNKNRATNKAKSLVLFETVADDCNLPKHHTKTAVGKLLNIPTKDTWVKLSSPKEINN